jgi:uncharacterized membrane protein
MKNRFELLCRAGYAARGVVYVLLGSIALTSAVSRGAGEPSSEGVFATILSQPFGRILLAAVALGLAGHVLWRLAEALLNADQHEHDAKGYLARAGNLASALTNGAIAFLAARLAIGSSRGQSGSEDGVAQWLLQLPFGRWLLACLGLAVIVAGLVQVWRGATKQYRKRVRLPREHSGLLNLICGFGLAARGMIIVLIGGFFLYAAFVLDPQQAGGTAEALDWARSLPFGFLIYSLAAAGLVAFGAYSFIEARYREMAVPNVGSPEAVLRRA